MKLGIPAILWLTGLLIAAPAAGKTWHVPLECPTIQAGIDSASAGDTVLVACGTYYEHDLVMKSGLCLRSASGDPACVTVDAQRQGRVIVCSDVDEATSVEGLTFTGGLVTSTSVPVYVGGGFYCHSSSPAVRSCVFLDNQATGTYGSGGGMACDGGSCPSFMTCLFSSNLAIGSGGGVFCQASSPSFDECQFSENRGGWPANAQGGGACCLGGSPSFVDCTFSGNRCPDGWGDGMYCSGGSPVLSGCWFMRNGSAESQSGGGLFCYGTSLMIEDCVFAWNSSAFEGGGLDCASSTVMLNGCTFYGNAADQQGGGIYLSYDNTLILSNTIIAFTAQGGAIASLGTNDTVTLSCCNVYGNTGGDWVGCIADQYGVNGNFSLDPLFCDGEDGDFRIQCDSPCAPGHHPDGYDCGLIGALGVGCGGSISESTTWSGVKALYR